MMKVNCFVWVVVSFVNIAAIITGLNNGGFNGILEMDGFKDTFSHLYDGATSQAGNESSGNNQTRGCSSGNGAGSDSLIGVFVSSASFGSFIGSLMAGWLSDQFGRKYGLSISGVVMLLGTVILSSSHFVWMLIVGRLLGGIAIGIFYMIMPVYVAEMAPKESRGMLVSIIGPTYTVGINIAFFANVGFAKFSIGWRVSIAIIAVFSLVFAVGMKFMPHTPRWLVKEGRDQEALLVLSRINHHPSTETFVDTCVELEELRNITDSKAPLCSILKELYQRKYRLLLGGSLFFFAAGSGSSIYYYTTTIFCEAGIPAFYASLIVGLVVLTASIVLTFFIDRLGRKKLFLICTFTFVVAGLTVAILLHLYDSSSEAVGYTIVVLICVCSFAFSCSWLTLPWVVNSEIFPVNIRGVTVGVAAGVYWFSLTGFNLVTPLIIGSPLQLHGFFYITTGFSIAAFFLVLFALPETKGVSLEQMDHLFSQSIWERFIETFKRSTSSTSSHVVESDVALEEYKYCSKAQEDFAYYNKSQEAQEDLKDYKEPDDFK